MCFLESKNSTNTALVSTQVILHITATLPLKVNQFFKLQEQFDNASNKTMAHCVNLHSIRTLAIHLTVQKVNTSCAYKGGKYKTRQDGGQQWRFKVIYTLSGEKTLANIFSSLLKKGSALKGKNMLLGSIFFPFRADPFFRTGSCSVQESKQEVTEVASLVGRKVTKCI